MSKIDLDPITSGYNLSKINANFQKIEDELNNKVLYRNSPAGEPNSMSSNLDMNSQSIFNANKISSSFLELGGVRVVPTNLATDPYNGTREALRRSYAEAGYNLVAGSFETGGTLTAATDVLLQESTGAAYAWTGAMPKVVAPGFDPVGVVGFELRTGVVLRSELTSSGSTIADIAGFKTLLSSDSGAAEVGASSGSTVQQEIDTSKARLDAASIRAPSLPSLGSALKMIIKPTIITDAKCLVVTRKAQGKAGYVAVALTDSVSPADSQNTGGASNVRPGYVLNLANAWVASSIYYAKAAGTVLSTLNAAQINTIWGYSLAGDEYYVETATAAVSWLNRQVYSLAANSDYITYAVTGKSCKVIFGMTNGSSAAADIMVSLNGVDFYTHSTVTTKQPPSGTVSRREVTVETGITGTWYVKIVNKTSAAEPCYVAGVNIMPLSEAPVDVSYDNAMISVRPTVNSVPNQYLGGTGANEFAAKDRATGKFFGTYHGGHSGLLQRLRTDGASYNLDSGSAPTLLLTLGVQLHSVSTLTTGTSVYSYVAETSIGDGVTITSYSLQLQSGSPAVCERAYTHMCTTMRDFDYIHLPKYLNKTDDGDVPVGQCQFIQQARSYDAAQLNCYFSGVDITENSNGGAYVSFQPNYNKQYYGPALNSTGYELTGGQFITAKEFF